MVPVVGLRHVSASVVDSGRVGGAVAPKGHRAYGELYTCAANDEKSHNDRDLGLLLRKKTGKRAGARLAGARRRLEGNGTGSTARTSES